MGGSSFENIDVVGGQHHPVIMMQIGDALKLFSIEKHLIKEYGKSTLRRRKICMRNASKKIVLLHVHQSQQG